MEISNSIKNWNLDDRPREKLINKGASVLSNAELMDQDQLLGTRRKFV